MEWYDPIVALATLGSVIVTTVIASFLYRQSKEMKNQTKNLEGQTTEMKKEISNRMRPWLKIGNIVLTHFLTKEGNSITEEELFDKEHHAGDIKEARFQYYVENVGSLPTEKFFVKELSKKTLFTKELLWEEGETDFVSLPLMPNEKILYSYTMKGNEFDNLKKTSNFFGVHIGYFVDGEITNTIGKIWQIEPGAVTTVDYWHNEPK